MTLLTEISTISIDPKSYSPTYGNLKVPQASSSVEGFESFAIYPEEVSDYITRQNEHNQFNNINLLNLSVSRKPLVPEVNSTLPFVEQIELSQWESMRDPEWRDQLRNLTAYASLPDDWNGYTAPPPSLLAIRQSRSFLSSLNSVKFPPYRLKPSVVGGIGFTFRREQQKVYVEFYNAGNAYALFYDSDSDSDSDTDLITKPVLTSKDGYLALIKEIREYFHD